MGEGVRKRFFYRTSKKDLLFDAETFSNCLFIPHRNCDVSTVSFKSFDIAIKTISRHMKSSFFPLILSSIA